MPTHIAIFPFLILLSSFIFWQSLRHDLPEDTLLKLILRAWFGALVGFLLIKIAGRLLPFSSPLAHLTWWVAFLSSLIYTLSSIKNHPFFWKIFDSLLFSIALFAFTLALTSQLQLLTLAFISTSFILLLISHRTYRRLRWYRSGKLGFIGFSSLIYLSLARLTLVFNHPPPLYWWHWLDISLAVLALIVAVFGLYTRSGRQLEEEKQHFTKVHQALKVIKVKINQVLRRRFS